MSNITVADIKIKKGSRHVKDAVGQYKQDK